MPDLTPVDDSTESLSPFGGTSSGAALALTVAAYNATAAEMAAADYVCDGTADDVQINAAIAAATASGYGGAVVLSSGQFRLAAPIIAPNTYGFSLLGQGREITQVRAASAMNDSLIKLPYNYATVGALTVDGNSAQNSAGSGILITGYKCTVENVNVSYAKVNGISVSGTSGAPAYSQRLSHLFIIDCAGDGINFTTYAYDSHMLDVWVGNAGGYGIYTESGTQIMTQCHVWGSTVDGIRLQNGQGSQIVGCYIESNDARGIRMGSGADYALIDSCFIWKNASGGIYTFSGDRGTISGCVITDNGGDSHGHGVLLDTSSRWSITGNYFGNESTTNQGRPVVETNGTDYTVYVGNVGLASNHFTGAEDITGANSVNMGNAGQNASAIRSATAGNLSSTNVQSALQELDDEKAGVVPFASGKYYSSPVVAIQNVSSATAGQNVAHYTPFYVSKTTTFDRIACWMGTAGDSLSKVRMGVHSNVNGKPGVVLVDSGQVAASAATGRKEATISLSLTPGLYWLVTVAQAATGTNPTLSRHNGMISMFTMWRDTDSNPNACWTATVSGALADSPSVSEGGGTTFPWITYLRAA